MAALQEAKFCLADGVKGGDPHRFMGPEVNEYLAAVGLGPGFPWCAAFVYHLFRVASTQLEVANPCPKTGSAVHLWTNADDAFKTQLPAPGDIFVVMHHDGVHGHCGIVESASPAGDLITTIEGDTNAEGSSTGDAVGRHVEWMPKDGSRGTLLGYLAF